MRRVINNMEKLFTALKIIAFIISKIIAFGIGLFVAFAVCSVTGIGTPIGSIFVIIFSCIPTMITVKIKGYSSWWVTTDFIVTALIFIVPIIILNI